MKKYGVVILILIIAALCKACQAPLSALLLQNSTPLMSFAFICVGSFLCAAFVFVFGRKKAKTEPEERHLQKKDLPYILIRIGSESVGGILFIVGISMCLASMAALIKCFTIVASALIAFLVFKEKISRKLGISIVLITLGCITIASGNMTTLEFSPGLLLVLASAVCGAISDNMGKKLAGRNPGEVMIVIEFFVTVIAFAVAFLSGESLPSLPAILGAILTGAIIYGAFRVLYQVAARDLGAAKCSTVTGLAPLLGAGLSLIIFQEQPTFAFIVALLLLIPGFYLVIADREDTWKTNGLPKESVPVEQYHDIRNYLTAFGLLSVFVVVFITIIENLQYLLTGSYGEGLTFATTLGIAITQVVIGCVLIILRRRDLTASILLMFGFSAIAMLLCGDDSSFIIGVLGIMMIILSVVLLLAKEKKKYCFSLLFMSIWVSYLIYFLVDNTVVHIVLGTVILVYLFLLVAGASGLLPRFPLTKVLAEDESLSFEKTGPFLCYIIIAVSVLPWMGIYLLGTELVPLASVGTFSIGCAVMLGILSLLLLFVGRDRFLGAVFLGVMLFLLLAGSTSYLSHYIAGIVMFLTGLFCLLRKKSYLLPGLMCILYGISSFTTMVIHGGTMLLISQFIMQGLTFLLAVYLAVAVFSRNRRLPVF